jgi:hypothetical protein
LIQEREGKRQERIEEGKKCPLSSFKKKSSALLWVPSSDEKQDNNKKKKDRGPKPKDQISHPFNKKTPRKKKEKPPVTPKQTLSKKNSQ